MNGTTGSLLRFFNVGYRIGRIDIVDIKRKSLGIIDYI